MFLLHSVTHLSRIRSHQLDCCIFIRICFSISILRHVLISEIVNVLLFYPPLLLLAADRPKGTEQPPGRDSCYTGRTPKMCLVQKVSVQTILYPAGRLLARCNSYPNLGSHVSTLPAHRWVQRLLGAQRVGRPPRIQESKRQTYRGFVCRSWPHVISGCIHILACPKTGSPFGPPFACRPEVTTSHCSRGSPTQNLHSLTP